MSECIKYDQYRSCVTGADYLGVDGNKYCILHLPIGERDKQPLHTEEFNRIILHKKSLLDFNFSGCQFDNNCLFSFNGGKDHKLNLTDCVFYHPVDFKNRNLGISEFKGANFYEDADFERTAFHKEVA